MKLVEKNFLIYKLLNSSFTGLSIGILIPIYNPLEPEVYSLGGIVLAGAMIFLANYYEKILNIRSFFWVTMFVELVMLLTIIIFFIFKFSLVSALIIYCGYQLTFIFGGYLVRAETLVAERKDFLSKIDIYKQLGYLVGLGASYIFYKALGLVFFIEDSKVQILILHYFLILLQSLIIIIALRSFRVE